MMHPVDTEDKGIGFDANPGELDRRTAFFRNTEPWVQINSTPFLKPKI